MSGKHDRSLDEEQSAKLLATGPIVIRGLGRSVKDALRPGPPSRHRAFVGSNEAGEAPVQAMLASGPTVAETGPSSDVADAPAPQDRSTDHGPVPAHEVETFEPEPAGPGPAGEERAAAEPGAVGSEPGTPHDADPDDAHDAGVVPDGVDPSRARTDATLESTPEGGTDAAAAQLASSLPAVDDSASRDARGSDEAALGAAAVELLSPDAADDRKGGPRAAPRVQVPIVAESTGEPAIATGDAPEEEQQIGGDADAAEGVQAGADAEPDPFEDPFLVPDELDEPEAAEADEPRGTAVSAAADGAAHPARPSSSRPGGSARSPRRPSAIRERFGREAIGIAVLVVLALACGGLVAAVVVKTQRDAAVAASEAANYTPPPLATPEPTATGPVVAVIGDGTTSAAAVGVSTSRLWSAVLGDSLDGTVTTDASSGMGYAAESGSGETFLKAAADVPSHAEVVIVFGGAADADVAPLSLAKAATDTYSAIRKQAPDAELIVVGPVIEEGVDGAGLTAVRSTLRSAASIAKATWIDPLDRKWLSTSRRGASSPSALTAADEKTIASKMEAAVKKALA